MAPKQIVVATLRVEHDLPATPLVLEYVELRSYGLLPRSHFRLLQSLAIALRTRHMQAKWGKGVDTRPTLASSRSCTGLKEIWCILAGAHISHAHQYDLRLLTLINLRSSVTPSISLFCTASRIARCDTPQMNSLTERWVRSLKEKVLCMLLRSSLPVAFWWLAVECAAYLLNRLSTKTVLGYMSPYECVYGAAPNLKWIRIWGCKCYALKRKADRRKDFDEKAYTGFLVGYAQQNTGYLVFVPALDKIVVSVHVVFNEIIPDPSAKYFSELERLKIEVASESRDQRTISSWLGYSTLMTRMALSMWPRAWGLHRGVSSAGDYSRL